MSETLQIILTSSITIIIGVIIYTTGQIVSKFVIEPIYEQRKIKGEIVDGLIFYANIYSNPLNNSNRNEKYDEASEKLRQLSTLLRAKTHLIPLYKLLEKLRIVLKSSVVNDVSKELIRLSNSIYIPEGLPISSNALSNADIADKIKTLLVIRGYDT